MHSYNVSGLSVRSEIALPGVFVPVVASEPDVTIRRRAVPQSLENPAASGPTWQMAGEQFLLRIPDIARFLLSNGREIAFEPEPEARHDDIPIFLLGTVFGILLHQREQIVLHASAVRINGKAVLFCGNSGAGKSTMAAALVQRGYPLVTDDVCAIAMTAEGVPMVYPDGRQLKLWAQSIDRLDLGERRGDRVRDSLEKFYVEPAEALNEPMALGAVYALREARPPHATGIERPNVVDAALILRRNAYRPMMVSRMGQKAHYFHAATTIARVAGIFNFTRRLDFALMPDAIASLERHWNETGLMEPSA